MHVDKRKFCVFLSPILVIIIMCVLYAVHGIFPFGSKTAAWCDMDQQTIPLLMNLKDVLDGKSSILYTTETGGGMNFWGVFFFFLASPFYLIVKFIPKQYFSYFVTVLLIIKMSVCSLTSSFYFYTAFKKIEKKYIILLSLIYTFSGFCLMYYQTLVWIDVMYMFPLLVWSIDKLCNENKNFFYILILSAVITMNYYLSYMIVIYLILSIPLYIFIRCPENTQKSVSLRFILSSLSSALITAPVWMCSLIQVRKSARSINNLAKFIFNSPFESLKDKLCIIITDAFIFAVLLFIIKSPLLKKKKVKHNMILISLLLIPVFIDPINKIWHGGGYQGFPLRYGYIITFTLLIIVCTVMETFPKCEKSSLIYSTLSFIITGLFSFTAVYVLKNRKEILSSYSDYLAITNEFFKTLFGVFIFAFFLYLLIFMLLRKKFISSNVSFILVSCIFITEVFVNVSAYVGYSSKNDAIFNSTMTLENKIKDETDCDALYRVKTEKKYFHVNMLGGLGLNSYAHYTSLTPKNYMFAMKKLGYSSYWMEIGSNGGTVLTDAILGMKYSIGYKNDFNSYQKLLEVDSDFYAAENLLCTPAGIISDTDPVTADKLDFTDSNERYDIQRQLSKRFFKRDDLVEKYDYTCAIDGSCNYSDGIYEIKASNLNMAKCRLYYKLKIKGHKVLYFDLFDDLSNSVKEHIYDSVKVSVNGIIITESFPNKKNNGLLELGEFENEDVEIKITFLKDVFAKSFGVFGINIDGLESELNNLETTELYLNRNIINAEYNAQNNTFLYLAVPWDSGFTAYLNGSKTQLYKVNDCFCAVKLKKGKNQLKMVFYPDGFRLSIILMIFGFITSVFLCIAKTDFFNNKKAGSAAIMLCRFIFSTAVIIIYAVPIIIYAAGLFMRF